MRDDKFVQLLSESVGEVLENMFFTGVFDEDASNLDGEISLVAARLSFRGTPSGEFGIRTKPETVQKLSASFLGEDESSISQSQGGEVLCELANMMCGSFLSRLEKDGRFELSKPELQPVGEDVPRDCVIRREFQAEEGSLQVWLAVEQSA